MQPRAPYQEKVRSGEALIPVSAGYGSPGGNALCLPKTGKKRQALPMVGGSRVRYQDELTSK